MCSGYTEGQNAVCRREFRWCIQGVVRAKAMLESRYVLGMAKRTNRVAEARPSASLQNNIKVK